MPTEPPEKSPRRYHRIGKYQVLAHVAAGGMGIVYKAMDETTGQEVALKILSPTLATRPTAVERFRREAQHGVKLRHDNIVAVFEFGEVNGTWFLASEFVEGIDLLEYVRRKGKLDPDEATSFLIQAARGLDWLHHHQIVHRDIKPSNFLITEVFGRKVVKLTDLGVAREANDDESRLTQAGSTVGTIDYMAPEQARDSGQADARSDVYSLGCTFFHMLAGHPPFHEGSLTERLFQHSEAEPPDVRQINPKVSFGLFMALRRMLAKKPEDRYQSAAELIRELSRLTGEAPGPARTLPDEPPALQPPVTLADTPPPAASNTGPQPRLRKSDTRIPRLPTLTPEQRRVAVQQFERAIQVMEKGQFEYGTHLLLSCCKLDPANLVYRQTLRRFQRANLNALPKGGPVVWVKGMMTRTRLKAAKQAGDWGKVLEYGEQLLVRNPGDPKVQTDMAQAAEALGLVSVAIWLLEQVWQKDAHTPPLNRALARLYEKRGNFMQATILWELVAKAVPDDLEAHQKIQDLAAKETIARGQYQEAMRDKP